MARQKAPMWVPARPVSIRFGVVIPLCDIPLHLLKQSIDLLLNSATTALLLEGKHSR
jgi:hypothetical protein